MKSIKIWLSINYIPEPIYKSARLKTLIRLNFIVILSMRTKSEPVYVLGPKEGT